MSLRLKLFLVIPVVLAGCARPKPDMMYQATVNSVQAASFSSEESSVLPREPELNGPHPVEYYIQLALERNPEILADRRTLRAHSDVIPQVRALDDPMLRNTYWPSDDHSPQTASGRFPNLLSLSQKFPWFGKLQLRGEIAFQEAEIALTQLTETELKVSEQVRIAYYEILFHQRAIQLVEASKELLVFIRSNADFRNRVNKGSIQDVFRADLELLKLQNRIIDFKRNLRVAQADLANLLHTSQDVHPEAETDPDQFQPAFVPEDIDRLYEIAARHRPQLQARYHAIVRDQRKQELARLNYYPDVTLGVGWQVITTDNARSRVSNGNDNIGITLGINLPLWREKLEAGVREAENRAIGSGRRYEATLDDTFRLIKRLMVQAEALQKQITLFSDPDRGITRQALNTFNASRADYIGGKVDFQQIIDNWTDLLEFRIQVARLEAGLNQTLASLERVVGSQLATLPETEPGEDQSPPSSR